MPNNISARQKFQWVLVSQLEMAPSSWGRPLREGDVRAIATAFDPDRLGAIAVWSRPSLYAGRGRYVIVDGQHRAAAVKLMGYDDQKVPCLLYEGLTMETAAELSLGLQERRNLHALDKHRAALAAHDRRAVDVDKIMHYCGLVLTYTTGPSDRDRVAAVGTINHVWDRMGDGLERVLNVCAGSWGRTSQGFASGVLKLVMTVMCAHNGEVDDAHLIETLATRSPAQWIARDAVPRRPLSSIAQDVIIEYNKKARGSHRLQELTPSEYEQAARRMPAATVRGNIEAEHKTSGRASRHQRAMTAERKDKKGE